MSFSEKAGLDQAHPQYHSPHIKKQAIDADADYATEKPYTVKNLRQVVNMLLGN